MHASVGVVLAVSFCLSFSFGCLAWLLTVAGWSISSVITENVPRLTKKSVAFSLLGAVLSNSAMVLPIFLLDDYITAYKAGWSVVLVVMSVTAFCAIGGACLCKTPGANEDVVE